MSKETKTVSAPVSLRVRARRDGFYKGQRIRAGMTFTLLRAEDFSAKWMATSEGAPDDLEARLSEPRAQATPKRTSVSIGNERMAAPLPRPTAAPKPTARAAAAGDDASVI